MRRQSLATQRFLWLKANRLPGENTADALRRWYDDVYLNSEHWLATRQTAIRQANGKCRICGTTSNLTVHHTTYKNLGDEDPTDLRVLCSTCHATQHNIVPDTSKPERPG